MFASKVRESVPVCRYSMVIPKTSALLPSMVYQDNIIPAYSPRLTFAYIDIDPTIITVQLSRAIRVRKASDVPRASIE